MRNSTKVLQVVIVLWMVMLTTLIKSSEELVQLSFGTMESGELFMPDMNRNVPDFQNPEAKTNLPLSQL